MKVHFGEPNMLGWALSIALVATAIAGSTTAMAEPLSVGGSVSVRVAPRSLKALRDENVVRQAQDYSCGAAALATLLSFGLGDAVTEGEILAELFAVLSPTDATGRQKDGFSLLDLQRVAQRRGYKAQAFRLAAHDLPRLNGPAIVFIEPDGYKHFAVLRGVRGDRIFLADPSRGNVRMPAYQFLQVWQGNDGTGIIFVVEPQTGVQAKSAMPLSLGPETLPQPEMLSARELLAVGAASSSPSQRHR